MYYYSPDNNERGKRIGLIGVIAYLAVWLVLFLTYSFKMDSKLSDEGLIIDFGSTEDGVGDIKTSVAQDATPPPPSRPQPADQIATRDTDEDVPEVPQPKPEQQRPDRNRPEQPAQQVTDPRPQEVEQPREVNPRALFPGRNPDQESTSSGTGSQTGNQGSPEGSNDGNSAGQRPEGQSFTLEGRRIVGDFPSPSHPGKNKSGKVLIEIIVDSSGSVTSASYRAEGSTTQDGELIGAARSAALRTKFTQDPDNPVQKGTITYIFKLN